MKCNGWGPTITYCILFLFILYGIAWYIDKEIKILFYLLIIMLAILGYLIATDKYSKIIKACDLGADGVYCKYKGSYKSEGQKVEIFSLAPGVCLTDFEKKKEHISQYLNKDIELKYESKCIHMKVCDINKEKRQFRS